MTSTEKGSMQVRTTFDADLRQPGRNLRPATRTVRPSRRPRTATPGDDGLDLWIIDKGYFAGMAAGFGAPNEPARGPRRSLVATAWPTAHRAQKTCPTRPVDQTTPDAEQG